MSAQIADWRSDLEASRDVTAQEQQHYGFVLAWYDSWRMRLGLPTGRDSAVRFWREQVQGKPRKEWQLERWAEAMRWHAQWLANCQREGKSPCSLAERLKQAVMQTGARRGLAMRTRETYAGWMAR